MPQPMFTFHCPTDRCDRTYPAQAQDIGRRIYCPECGRIVEITPPRVWRTPQHGRLWRRVLAWVAQASPPTGRALPSGQPQPSPGIERLLHELGHRAWRKEAHHPPGSFLLAPAMLRPGSDTATLETNLRVLYDHARRWA